MSTAFCNWMRARVGENLRIPYFIFRWIPLVIVFHKLPFKYQTVEMADFSIEYAKGIKFSFLNVSYYFVSYDRGWKHFANFYDFSFLPDSMDAFLFEMLATCVPYKCFLWRLWMKGQPFKRMKTKSLIT